MNRLFLIRNLTSKSYAPAASTISLNKTIVQMNTLQEMNDLIVQTPDADFDHISCSTAISRIGKLVKSQKNSHKSIEPQFPQPAIKKLIEISLNQKFRPRDAQDFAVGVVDGDLFQYGEEESKKMIEKILSSFSQRDDFAKFEPWHISNCLLSFARLQINDVKFIEKCSKELLSRKDKAIFKPKELTNILFSLASFTNYKKDEKLIQQICEEIQKIGVPNFENSDLCFIGYSIGKLQVTEDAGVLSSIGTFFEYMGVKKLSPSSLSKLCWSFTVLGKKNDRLFRTVAREIEFRLTIPFSLTTSSNSKNSIFNGDEASTILESFAKLRVKNPDFISLFVNTLQFDKMTSTVGIQQVIKMVWSLSCLDILQDQRKFLSQSLPIVIKEGKIDPEIEEMIDMLRIDSSISGSTSTFKLMEELLSSSIMKKSKKSQATKFGPAQKEIQDLLKEMEITKVNPNFVTPAGLFMDLYLPEQKVGIKFVEKVDYFEDGKNFVGKTAYYQRLFGKEGYPVKSIHVTRDWKQLSFDEEKKKFLVKLLGLQPS